MKPKSLILLLADAECLNEGQGGAVSCRSTERRVCLFLKQQANRPVLSQSHSGGAALVAASATPFAAGVDIEKIRPRDFRAAAALACSKPERRWLAQRGWQAEDYYRLWVLKEALIKASGADFPADLPHTGIMRAGGSLRLVAAGKHWHGFAALCGGWALAAVWPQNITVAARWRRYGPFARQGGNPERIWMFSN